MWLAAQQIQSVYFVPIISTIDLFGCSGTSSAQYAKAEDILEELVVCEGADQTRRLLGNAAQLQYVLVVQLGIAHGGMLLPQTHYNKSEERENNYVRCSIWVIEENPSGFTWHSYFVVGDTRRAAGKGDRNS